MKIEIEIEDPSRCYCAGQTVKGDVLLLSTTGAPVKGVTIKCVGRVSTKWWVQRHNHRRRRYERLVYFTSVQQHTVSNVPVGHTKIPFAFQLPIGTPSSFNGKYGHVVYFIEAVVERAWKSNTKARQYFSFNTVVDLNTFPGATSPIELYKEKTSFSFFCGRGLISARLNFPRSGFVGGQPLDFVLEVKNFSARNIPTVNLSLVQKCTFKVKARERKSDTRVLEIQFPEGVGPGEEQVFIGSESAHTIPPLPPTGLGGCPIIDVNYCFQVEMDLFAEATIRESVPVIIGTIPLRELFIDLLPGTAVSANGVTTATATAPSFHELDQAPAPGYFSPGLYPDLPPPTYQEAIMLNGFGKSAHKEYEHRVHVDGPHSILASAPVGDQDGDEDPYFIPKYTMYEWKN